METHNGDPISIEFPRRRRGQLSPPDEYASLREQSGLVKSALPNGSTVWLVTRHDDVRTVLTDPRISASPLHEGFPTIGRNGTVPPPDQIPGWFVAYDPPEHTRFRKALIPEFTVRRIAELRPAVQRVVDTCIDDMLATGTTADLVSAFALPVPSLIICELLGVPRTDRELFESRTRILVTFTSTDDERESATRDLLLYISKLIAMKQRFPGRDLTSRLLSAGVLTPKEISGVALLLLIAGHETTANNIALGVVMLLLNRQWVGAPGVVEEVLRYLSVADRVALRVAIEDIEIGGHVIKAGEGIVPLGAAANHDHATFERADEFDPSRSARHHVAFGYGVHQCLGQNLVRVEMEAVFTSLFQRIPTLQLDLAVEDLPFKYDGVLFGLHALPVRW
ncbi:cytochrome P450 [Streptosporangium sp. NBC_01755]|uniref:cytochrome P450 n=1 Tax=unclassified Streptosporangium TaxID=2632669 RepID=UPI002DDBF887|nr:MULTISPECIES: cytochrome P450 [unclassified Streptosporangium]WSA29366.1 cytochrome P450 [Streptosporangium sp. NBC_01810]WSC99190.1 cytochrome P450 [Streptosporangium sp. NBC_01755]